MVLPLAQGKVDFEDARAHPQARADVLSPDAGFGSQIRVSMACVASEGKCAEEDLAVLFHRGPRGEVPCLGLYLNGLEQEVGCLLTACKGRAAQRGRGSGQQEPAG